VGRLSGVSGDAPSPQPTAADIISCNNACLISTLSSTLPEVLTASILNLTMSQYEASVPDDGSLKPGIASFFEAFYAISDTAEAHEQYADHFTSDAKLIMASKETSGRQGMLSLMHFLGQKKLI
jgi:hypothetical protein